MMIDLRRVRVFYEVAQRRSFSAAAEALQYTQPSVSHHIAALERELGQRLINRGVRPLTLTPAGEILRAAAAVALAEVDRAELELCVLAGGGSGRVSLGSVVTGMRSVVPAAVVAFRERFPQVELVIEESAPADVLGRLRSGQLDVGIVVLNEGADELDPAVFSAHLLAEQPIFVALPAGHRLARRRYLELGALRGERWVLPAPARFPDFRAWVDRLLAAAGVVPEHVLESSDDIAGARLVAAGVGVGVTATPQPLVAPGVALVPLRPRAVGRLQAVTIAGVQALAVRGLLDELRAAAALIPPLAIPGG